MKIHFLTLSTNFLKEEKEKVLFYELVEFCSLSERKFNEMISKIEAEAMTHQLWTKLKKCFFTNGDVVVKSKTEEERKSLNMKRYAVINKHKYTTVEYGNNGNNRFNGIIAKLEKVNPVSVIDNGIINITSSHVVVNIPSDTNGCFHSCIEVKAWLTVDFKDRKVKPSFYSIRSD